jgi:hypothetical protein
MTSTIVEAARQASGIIIGWQAARIDRDLVGEIGHDYLGSPWLHRRSAVARA